MNHHPSTNTDKPPLHKTLYCWICRVLRHLKRCRGPTLLRLLLGLWVIWGDPFGLSSASDKALSNDLSRIRAYVRPVNPAPITVVNIDYPSIKALHAAGLLEANDWPLTYKDHERILKVLVSTQKGALKPAAVFYDIFFERPRSTSGDMAALGKTLTHAAKLDPNTGEPLFPPIFLAGGGSYMPMSDESYHSLGERRLAATAWDGHGDYYPLFAPLREPLAADHILPDTTATAAYALYRQLCKAQDRGCDWLDTSNLPPLAVQWEVLKLPGCSGSAADAPDRILSTLARYLGLGSQVEVVKPECLPFHQVALHELYGPTPKSLKPPHLTADQPYVVLAGVTMESLNDYHQTPLYGKIAGVYLHAAATENLFRLESDYVHERDIRLFSTAIWFLIVLLAARHAAMNKQSKKHAHRPWHALLLWPLYLILAATFIVLVYCLCYGLLDIAPEGWLFMIGLVFLICPKPGAVFHA